MSREQEVIGIILKKQQYLETDEIITLYSRELGKVRARARGVRKVTSKLQYSMQVMSEVKLFLGTSGLYHVNRAERLRVFPSIHASPEKIQLFFWAAEILLKATPDEEPNEKLFIVMENFLQSLELGTSEVELLKSKFLTEVLDALGLGLKLQDSEEVTNELYFSNIHGGFHLVPHSDSALVSAGTYQRFCEIKKATGMLNLGVDDEDVRRIFQLLSGFLVFHIERQINSQKFLSR